MDHEITTNIEALEKYAEEHKIEIPDNVKKVCNVADELKIQLITRLNFKSTEAKGCEAATNVRNILIKSEKDMPIYNELKTMFLKCKNFSSYSMVSSSRSLMNILSLSAWSE